MTYRRAYCLVCERGYGPIDNPQTRIPFHRFMDGEVIPVIAHLGCAADLHALGRAWDTFLRGEDVVAYGVNKEALERVTALWRGIAETQGGKIVLTQT